MAVPKPALENKKVEEKPSRHKMTIYIDKSVAKKFKMLAIELEKDFSQLSELAFTELLEKYSDQLFKN